ncbi:MAG: hypothetical protein AAGF78_06690 [Pseudomonadota bacterium]
MLKFLFGAKSGMMKSESQRDTFERLVKELNEAVAALPQKPKVTVDLATGAIAFDRPDQFPDEALALPKPEAVAPAPGTKPADAPAKAPVAEVEKSKAA